MIVSTNAPHILNDLLQGEIAATETYQQALAKYGSEPGAEDLRSIHVDHREAANRLRQYVHELGDQPSQGSQVWGAFAKAVEGVATMLGNTTAIQALRAGEENGRKHYAEAVTNENLPKDVIEFVRGSLLPKTQEHVQTLDRLLKSGR